MPTALTQDIFQKTLASEKYTFFTDFYYHTSVESTNKTAKKIMQTKANTDTVIMAAEQTHGRGRYTRHWYSPPGGLYLSFILHPHMNKKHLPVLPLLTAVSVHTSLSEYGLAATIKWPNDVLVKNQKIAGILLETQAPDSASPIVICGIGININNNVDTLPPKLLTPATSMKQELGQTVDLLRFTTRLLHIYEKNYRFLKENKPDVIIAQWKQASDTLGKQIAITQHYRTIHGVAVNIDADGFLLVRDLLGQLHRVTSGDCQYIMDAR